MRDTRSMWWSLFFSVLATASCGDESAGGKTLPVSLELLAGDIGGSGNVDGTGAMARFFDPEGVAVDDAGNLYIADQDNYTIRKITAAGVVTTLAGTAGEFGSADGIGADARFSRPSGVAIDDAGNLYIADQGNYTIRKITAAGAVTTLAGTAGMFGSADGIGADARFASPSGVAIDDAGNLYIADQGSHTIRKITTAGAVTTLAGTAGVFGNADGTGADARFGFPSGTAVDRAGNVYVGDLANSTIRKITAAGVVTTLAGVAGIGGSADGVGADARFFDPSSLAVDDAGNVFVTDTSNNTIRKVSAAGVVVTLAGAAGLSGSTDGAESAARFYRPVGIATDGEGNVFVADSGNHTVRKITAAGMVTTLAGSASEHGRVDGTGAMARFDDPDSLSSDTAGNVYVADNGGTTIRKITIAGVVTTLAGTPGVIGADDGTGANAEFSGAFGTAVDDAGNVYVADNSNHTIRKISASGVVTTLAGSARERGSVDGIGPDARFTGPAGVAVDGAGSLYVTDLGNATIRKVSAAGVVTTLAGTAGVSGSTDGAGADARFDFLIGVAVDGAGTVYVTDLNCTIRKLGTDGVVTTLAGAADILGRADGAGIDARFTTPIGMAVDSTGNIYVADSGNATIRKITPTGVTTTIAGSAGSAGILLSTTPRFSFPTGVAIVGDSLVVSDNNAILLLRHAVQ
jgi:sugar lactone lactonase YvrE